MPFNVWVRYFVWNLKGTLWNSTQNILSVHWKMCISFTDENLRALRFKRSYAFLKRPPGPNVSGWMSPAFTYVMNLIIVLTHWGCVTHICVSKLTIIGSDNDLSPGRRQAIICPNAGMLLIGPLGTNFSEIMIEIYIFSLKKMHLKMSSGKWRPSCLSLNVLKGSITYGNTVPKVD